MTKIVCPHCGEAIERFPKHIRLRDHSQMTNTFQMIEKVSDINPPNYSRTHKFTQQGRVSRIPVYYVTEDK